MSTTPALHGPRLHEPPFQGRWRLAGLWARLRSPSIDRGLSAGAATWSTPLHAQRSLQLTSHRRRQMLARCLDRLIEDTNHPQGPLRAAVQPNPEQIRDAAPVILAVAEVLRADAPIHAQGVAMLRKLLTDGAGPCYAPSECGALEIALEEISQALRVEQ